MILSWSIAKKSLFFIFVFLILGLISCTKKTDETFNKDDDASSKEVIAVNDEDFTETDEDLLTVDYKEFYDELAPHGEWIEVTDKEVGLELKKGSASGEGEHRKISLSELFGVKEVYADDVSFGAFFVWKPAPNLAVSVVTGEPQPVYVPYSNGQWVYTDAGWYFKAPTPYEEIVHHHGRWVYSPTMGWVWMPGRVWAPAWVEWREHDTYIAWTPIPPSVYIVNSVVIVPPIYPIYTERYVIVERRYFVEPNIYKYHYKEHKNKIMIKEWRKIDGVTVMNKTVINKGPDVAYFEKIKGNKIEMVKINKIKSKDKVKYSSNEYDVYSPDFKKVKSKGNVDKTVTKPKEFIKYENADSKGQDKKLESSSDKDKGKDKDKGSGKDNLKNDDKSKGNEKFKGEDKSKGNEKKSDDKGKYNEDKSKGNKKSDDGSVKDNGKGKDKGNDKQDKGPKKNK